LDGRSWPTNTNIAVSLNGTTVQTDLWVTSGDLSNVPSGTQPGFINGSDQLLNVTSDSNVQFFLFNAPTPVTMGTCHLVITRVQ
jgi:hypothetical protein